MELPSAKSFVCCHEHEPPRAPAHTDVTSHMWDHIVRWAARTRGNRETRTQLRLYLSLHVAPDVIAQWEKELTSKHFIVTHEGTEFVVSVPNFTEEELAEERAKMNTTKSSATVLKDKELKAEEPKAEEPKVEEPKAEEPKAEEIKAEEPKAGESKALISGGEPLKDNISASMLDTELDSFLEGI